MSGRFFMSVGVFEEKRQMDVSCGNMSMDVAPNNKNIYFLVIPSTDPDHNW